jgi:aminoglycoside phosphotransferase (APT) family kinase protein
VLERPFYVMERLPGEVPLPTAGASGSGPFTAAEREALAPQVAGALARLHAVDWRKRGFEFLGVPAPGTGAAARELARWEERIARAGFALPPLLADSLGWLRRSLPEAPEITLVHGDFRLGNWLVEQRGDGATLLGVLDWEMVHLGDPLEDLAWCSCELWRGGTPWASAMVAPEALASAYAAASGRAVDAARMAFYRVLAVVKMIAIMLTGIRAFCDGRTADLRMAIFDHQLPFLMALLALARGWLPGG